MADFAIGPIRHPAPISAWTGQVRAGPPASPKRGREKGFPESALEQRQSIHIKKVMSGSKPSAVASTVAAL